MNSRTINTIGAWLLIVSGLFLGADWLNIIDLAFISNENSTGLGFYAIGLVVAGIIIGDD